MYVDSTWAFAGLTLLWPPTCPYRDSSAFLVSQSWAGSIEECALSCEAEPSCIYFGVQEAGSQDEGGACRLLLKESALSGTTHPMVPDAHCLSSQSGESPVDGIQLSGAPGYSALYKLTAPEVVRWAPPGLARSWVEDLVLEEDGDFRITVAGPFGEVYKWTSGTNETMRGSLSPDAFHRMPTGVRSTHGLHREFRV